MSRQVAAVTGLLILLTCLLLLWPGVSSAQTLGSSQTATWTCTGSPCPWGVSLSGQALVWPAALGPTTSRLGYTTSTGVYLPGSTAAGMTIGITSGTAGVYAGLPNAGSHRQLTTLAAGQTYLVGGLAAGEVVSVQADQVVFGYTLTLPTATPPAPATPLPTATSTLVPATATLLPTATPTLVPATATPLPTATPTLVPATATLLPTATPTLVPATATPFPTATPTLVPPATVPPQSSGSSQTATWTCTGSPCPWGVSLSGQALVWPAALGPTTSRLGYTTSTGVYLPGSTAAGMTIGITSGTAGVYAGLPSAGSHRQLAALAAGQTYLVGGLAAGEVVSVQADQVAFGYALTLPTATPPATATPLPTATSTLVPPATATPFPTATPTLVPATATPLPTATPTLVPATATPLPTATPTLVPATATPLPTATPTLVPATATLLPTATPTLVPATATPLPTATPTLVPATATLLPTATPTLVPPATVPPQTLGSSQTATWTCTGSPCPWGISLSGQALAWPAALGPTTSRLGYTTSTGVYLPGSTAAGMTIGITSGTAGVYAGLPNAGSHRQLTTLAAGQTYLVGGLAAGEVVSVQADEVAFGYALTLPTATPPATATPFLTATPTLVPPATGTPLPTGSATPLPTATLTPPTATPSGCVDPMACNPVSSINGFWKCNIAGCREPDWIGAAINWPSWAAYSTNARAGGQSRTVSSAQGELLYPYMGAWANGCQVTAVAGPVLIIEWKRGTDVWRETHLSPGQTHTISLLPTEDGAMIESNTWEAFSVILNNCNPQSIETAPTPTVVEPAAVGAATQPEVGGAANISPRLFLPLVSP